MRQLLVKSAFVASIALIMLVVAALAQDLEYVPSDTQKVLYRGNGTNESDTDGELIGQIMVGSWGAGTCKQVDDPKYGEGDSATSTLLVTTEGYYEGARLDFKVPVDLTKCLKTPDVYLRFAIKFPPGQGQNGQVGFAPMPGMDGGITGAEPASSPGQPVIRGVRVALYLDNGEILATTPQMVDISRTAAKGWAWLSLPFGAFKSAVPGGKIPAKVMVKRLIVCGNTADTLNIGEIRTEEDSAPIQARAGDDQVVAAYDPVVFQGEGESRVCPLKYSWDFNAGDGIQDDSVGPVAVHRFPIGGTYTVTLTVSDPMGIKKPATSTCQIEVND